MLHGAERYLIEGEGVIEGPLLPVPGIETKSLGEQFLAAADPFMNREKALLTPTHRFCRLFGEGSQPDPNALAQLGLAMEDDVTGHADPDSSIPAGYTYFGQFVDHDITFDPTPLTLGGGADPTGTANLRTPSLDLDSVYGGGPEKRPDLYENDGVTLKIGICTESADPNGGNVPALPNDLPRINGKAILGDPRNDENLAVAQIHLAFLKFHNSFVERLRQASPTLPARTLFRRAREETVKHYQRIILRDFLPKIIDVNALQLVLSDGHMIYPAEKHDQMPIEFSVGAYRLGHSMIRPTYEWNRVFNSRPGSFARGDLELLFVFSGVSGSLGGQPTLPSNWVADWRLLFDVEGHPPAPGFEINRARRIDTNIAFPLSSLPEFALAGVSDPALLSLASRNLLRGRLVKLAHGLEVADAIEAAGLPHEKLTLDQLRGGRHGPKLEEVGLLETPPLWYYVLREGELEEGERLGAAGSTIIAETMVALIRNSEISVLADPSINSLSEIPRFSISDMLKQVNDLAPV